MNKSFKGALAAGSAAVILFGGAGSLAYWNGETGVNGGDINSGNLVIDAKDCDTALFTVANAIEGVKAGTAFDIKNDQVVPGDVLTKTCDVDIVAVATNLKADLAVSGGDATGELADSVKVAPTFELNDEKISQITDADSGESVTATIVVDFPIGTSADNDSKLSTLNIAKYTVTATQVFTAAS